MKNYKLEDLRGNFTTKDGEEKTWTDESAMLGHLLLNEVVWCRDAGYVLNAGTLHEYKASGTIVLVNVSDVFMWGCADAEDLSHEDIEPLFLMWDKDGFFGVVRWVCKKRNEKPQWPIVRDMRKKGCWDEEMQSLPDNRSSPIPDSEPWAPITKADATF
jgi:hypothetical protein